LRWGEVHKAAALYGVRWLYDLTPRFKLGLIRAYRTALHALLPWHFWRRVTTDVPASPARLCMWPLVLFLPAYVLMLLLNTTHEYLCHKWMVPPGPFALEFFAPFAYDAGEMSPTGQVAPLWFPDREIPGRVAGGILPALMLLALARSRRTAGIRPVHLARAATYAQLHFLSALLRHAFALLVALDGNFSGGIRLGRGFYHWWGVIGRCEGYALTAWLTLWWYFACTRGLRLPRALALAAAFVAVMPLVIATLGYWRYWGFRWHAF